MHTIIGQTISDEDEKIRYEIREKFGEEGGFDGKQMYKYNFFSSIGTPKTKKNINYTTTYRIEKSGALEELSKDCDLETFLKARGFENSE